MIETVFALLLIIDNEIKEHRIQDSLSKCLKAKRYAMRDKGTEDRVTYQCIKSKANIYFSGIVGEEGLGDLSGVKYLFNSGNISIDYYIAVDGGGLDRIVTTAVGSHRYKVTFKGPGGHSWGAFSLACLCLHLTVA